jgi:hypothetical protein
VRIVPRAQFLCPAETSRLQVIHPNRGVRRTRDQGYGVIFDLIAVCSPNMETISDGYSKVVEGEPAVSSVGNVLQGSTRMTRLGRDGGVSGIVGDLPLGRNCLTLGQRPDPGGIHGSIAYSLHGGGLCSVRCRRGWSAIIRGAQSFEYRRRESAVISISGVAWPSNWARWARKSRSTLSGAVKWRRVGGEIVMLVSTPACPATFSMPGNFSTVSLTLQYLWIK